MCFFPAPVLICDMSSIIIAYASGFGYRENGAAKRYVGQKEPSLVSLKMIRRRLEAASGIC